MTGALRLAAGCALIAMAAAGTTAAGATPAPAGATMITEIIVTAERHEQSVQKTPLTIQVLDAARVRAAGVSTPEDLGRLVPGLDIAGGSNSTQIYIRGVGDFSYSPLANPGVAFNVDGVYVGRPDAIGGVFYDIERIEVLKGPQGTLYGRNANGGSINVITRSPTIGRYAGDLNLDVGAYSLVHVDGAVNIPLGQSAAVRAAFNVVDRGGYLSDGTNDDVQQAGRLRLKWVPTGDVTLQLNLDAAHLGGRGGGTTWSPRRPGADPWEAVASPGGRAYLAAFGSPGPLITPFAENSHQNTRLWNLSGQLDWNLGFATLSVIPAYRRSDVDTLGYPQFTFRAFDHTAEKTLEVRLGATSPRLTWVAGLYYFDEGGHGENDIFESNVIENERILYRPDTAAYAAFGQATVAVADGVRLIGGARYTGEDRSLTGSLIDDSPLHGGPNRTIERFDDKKRFGGLTWKAGLEADVAPHSMAYLTYSTGFKAGGLNQTVAPDDSFRPETLEAFELGLRSHVFENRLQANLSLFHWTYNQIQDQRVAFDPLGNINFLTFNSGTAIIQGVNWDIAANLTGADTLSLTGEYAASHYRSFEFQIPAPFFKPLSTGCRASGPYPAAPMPVIRADCSGLPVARVPRWSGSLAYDHVLDLAAGGSITVGGDARFSSSYYLATDFAPSQIQGGYVLFGADLTYRPAGRVWTVGAYVRNIGNVAYSINGTQQAFVAGLFAANIAPPRTFGVRARMAFD